MFAFWFRRVLVIVVLALFLAASATFLYFGIKDSDEWWWRLGMIVVALFVMSLGGFAGCRWINEQDAKEALKSIWDDDEDDDRPGQENDSDDEEEDGPGRGYKPWLQPKR